MGMGIQGVLVVLAVISCMVDLDDLVMIDLVTNNGHSMQFLFGELFFITGVRFVHETPEDMTFKMQNEILN